MLIWNNLTVDAGKKRILDNVHGYALPGRILALMGPSGSGKSTLLNTLACDVPRNFKTGGSIKYGEDEISNDYVHNISFLDQEESYLSYYTVSEYLEFCTTGRNRNMPIKNIKIKIEYYLEKLRLAEQKDVQIGKLSGGQKKRFLIAAEFLSEKPILFLDEPSSGLDSHLALEFIYLLQKIAREENRLVIITLHQPGLMIMNAIDDLLVLNKGQTLYCGPVKEAENFFRKNEFSKPVDVPLMEYIFLLESEVPLHSEMVDQLPKFREYLKAIPKDFNDLENSGKTELYLSLSYGFRTFYGLMKRNYRHCIISRSISITYIISTLILVLFAFIGRLIGKEVARNLSTLIDFQNNRELDVGGTYAILSLVIFYHPFLLLHTTLIYSLTMKEYEMRKVEIRKGVYTFLEFLFAIFTLQNAVCGFSVFIASLNMGIFGVKYIAKFVLHFGLSQCLLLFQSFLLSSISSSIVVVFFLNILLFAVRFLYGWNPVGFPLLISKLFLLYKGISILFPLSYCTFVSLYYLNGDLQYLKSLLGIPNNIDTDSENSNLLPYENICATLKDFGVSPQNYLYLYPLVFIGLIAGAIFIQRRYYARNVRIRMTKI